jgi:hypothetical protein
MQHGRVLLRLGSVVVAVAESVVRALVATSTVAVGNVDSFVLLLLLLLLDHHDQAAEVKS